MPKDVSIIAAVAFALRAGAFIVNAMAAALLAWIGCRCLSVSEQAYGRAGGLPEFSLAGIEQFVFGSGAIDRMIDLAAAWGTLVLGAASIYMALIAIHRLFTAVIDAVGELQTAQKPKLN